MASPQKDKRSDSNLIDSDSSLAIQPEYAKPGPGAAEYRELFAHSMDGVLLTAPTGEILYANPAACTLFGYTEAELQAGGRELVVDPNDPRLPVLLAERRNTGQARGVLTLIRRDGTRFEGEVSAAMFTSDDGYLRSSMFIRDITERSQARTALHDSEMRFSNIITATMDAVIGVNVAQEIELFNPAAEKMFGYQAGEVIGKPLEVLIPERFRKHHNELVNGLRKTSSDGPGMGNLASVLGLRQNGEEFLVEASISHYEQNGQAFYTVILRDITERQRTQQALRESEERFRAIVNSGSDMIYTLDTEQRYTGAFGNWVTSLGLTSDDLIGKCAGDIFGAAVAAVHEEQNARALVGESVVFDWQVEINGQVRYYQTALSPLRRDGDVLYGLVGIGREVTTQKKTELALQVSEARYRNLVEQGPDIIYQYALTGGGVYYSPQVETILGYSPAQLEQNPFLWQQSIHPVDLPRVNQVIRNFEAGQSFELEYRITDAWGQEHWLLDRSIYRHDAQHGVTIEGVATDITPRKQIEEALRESESRLSLARSAGKIGIWDMDLINDRLIWDERMYEIYDVEPETFGGAYEAWQRSVHPDDLASADAEVQQAIRDRREFHTEFRVIRPAGEVRHIEAHGLVIYNAEGQPLRMVGVNTDVTERKQAEKALRDSEAKLSRLVQNINAGIVVHAPDTHILLANERASILLGLTIDQLLGKTAIDPAWNFIHDDGSRMPLAAYPVNQVLSQQSPLSDFVVGINRPVTRDVVWVLVNAFPEMNEDGTIRQVVVTFIDITHLKRTEKALRDSEQRYQEFITQSFEGIYRTEFDHPVDTRLPVETQIDLIYDNAYMAECNLALARMYNMPAVEALIGVRLIDAHGGRDNPINRAAFSKFIKNGYKSINDETVEYDVNGDSIWFLSNTIGFVENGYLVRMWGTALEITDRKLAEKALRDSEENLRITLNSIGDAVIATDTSSRIVRLNPVAERLSGWSQAEALGQPFQQVFPLSRSHSREPVANPVETVLATGQPADLSKDARLTARDGRGYHVTHSGAPIQNAQGETIGVVLVLRDVTQELQTERELLKARQLESLGILAGGIAHDFNNLLTALSGNLELAKLALPSNHQSYRYLEAALTAGEKAVGLSNQLLTFAKGGAPIKEVQDIRQLLVETADFVMHGSKSRLIQKIAPDLWMAEVDRGQLSQVMGNLIINAQQAMPTGGAITLSAVNVVADDGQPHIKITLQDEGSGIAPETLKKIFDPYFSTKPENSGLGLTTVHSIITKHNGQITVASQLQQGTTFTMLLPASPQASPAAAPTIPAGNLDQVDQARILVLDDDALIRVLLEEMLTQLGYLVTVTAEGTATIDAYQAAMSQGEPYQAVILDLTIPGGLGGEGVAKEILALDPRARLIVSSGYATDPIIANHTDYGFKAQIQKPYRLATLQQTLQKVMR